MAIAMCLPAAIAAATPGLDRERTIKAKFTSCKKCQGPKARISAFFREGVVVSKEGGPFAMDESLLGRIQRMAGL